MANQYDIDLWTVARDAAMLNAPFAGPLARGIQRMSGPNDEGGAPNPKLPPNPRGLLGDAALLNAPGIGKFGKLAAKGAARAAQGTGTAGPNGFGGSLLKSGMGPLGALGLKGAGKIGSNVAARAGKTTGLPPIAAFDSAAAGMGGRAAGNQLSGSFGLSEQWFPGAPGKEMGDDYSVAPFGGIPESDEEEMPYGTGPGQSGTQFGYEPPPTQVSPQEVLNSLWNVGSGLRQGYGDDADVRNFPLLQALANDIDNGLKDSAEITRRFNEIKAATTPEYGKGMGPWTLDPRKELGIMPEDDEARARFDKQYVQPEYDVAPYDMGLPGAAAGVYPGMVDQDYPETAELNAVEASYDRESEGMWPNIPVPAIDDPLPPLPRAPGLRARPGLDEQRRRLRGARSGNTFKRAARYEDY